jgi:outer membrane protein W
LPLGEELAGSNGNVKLFRFIILVLLLGAAVASAQAQESAPPTNTVAAVNKSVLAKKGDVYHLDTSFGYRRSLNGDYDWVMPATIAFGKMMNDHLALDAAFGGGIIELKPGSPADAQAHQPFFMELGIVLRYYFAAREAPVKPYVIAGASVLWMSWEYRSPVDSPEFGFITRDYLEGADGYVGVGLSLRLRKHLNLFGEIDAGGIGFLSSTYSGVHNDLFRDFGYVGARGGLSLTF